MKIQIENPILRGQSQDWVLQRVASAYQGALCYNVYAPARATGDALQWVDNFIVRIQSESGQGENNVSDQASKVIIQQVKQQLEKRKLSSEIWSLGNNDASYYAGQICLRGHVQSSDGKHEVGKGEHCPQCGNAIIDACPSCEAPIRGQDVCLHREYVRPSFCHKCGRGYPWMEDRFKTARELLYHDDKLTEKDREELWPLLQDVMSSPKDDTVPAKRRLIDIKLGKAGQVTKEVITDLIAKTIAEMFKP